MKTKAGNFFVILGIMFICSLLLLMLVSVVIWKVDAKGSFLCGSVIAVYIITNLLGGFLTGKMMGQQKFFWGMLTGATYFFVLLAAGVCLMGTKISGNTQLISGAMICIISAMAGGMFAPAAKQMK
ncbi:MAG: TIGR04086 family membrane protein [Butyribacter sp.]|nr:TIGR04086 family membrane protein [bacterium]MDY3853632.1 TIGR04086 family membrane protein [Butyribacter sp.]